MKHTAVGYGWYDLGIEAFNPEQPVYWNKNDRPESPSGKIVDDWKTVPFPYKFRFFVDSDGFVFAGVQDIVLGKPTRFVPGRHEKKGFGPKAAQFTDDTAAAILVDMIIDNPDQRDELATLLRRLPAAT